VLKSSVEVVVLAQKLLENTTLRDNRPEDFNTTEAIDEKNRGECGMPLNLAENAVARAS